ncbi:MAG: aspartate-semialdehyde dehydrogenase [Candidatus Omnitrophota bacterium]
MKKRKYNVCVVGVGAVGEEMLKVLKYRKFPIEKLSVLARSERDITVDGALYQVKAITPESFENVDIALFAGTEGEKGAAVTYAAEAVKRGCIVIDNGADFRMQEDVPLVVPEINKKDLKNHKGIIANPNCSTIQMVAAIFPIHKRTKIKRIIVTTFQSASGAGRAAVTQLFNETNRIVENQKAGIENIALDLSYSTPLALPGQIAFNVIPHIGGFGEDDYTSEEWKMVHETHKIMHTDKIKISATCVRVPVTVGHAEAVYIETKKELPVEEVRQIITDAPGLVLIDNITEGKYPVPLNAANDDQVYIGRIRRDPYIKGGMWLWVVADNLRKGAATNAVQIAEALVKMKLVRIN